LNIVDCSSCCGTRATLGHRRHLAVFAKMALRQPGDGLGGAPWDRGRRSWLISRGTVGGQWIFVPDRFACGRRFRILNAGDDVTQECLAAIPGTSISGGRVARQVKHDRLRQWNHVHLGAGRQDRLAFDRPRSTLRAWKRISVPRAVEVVVAH
jgi:hypothetical protein